MMQIESIATERDINKKVTMPSATGDPSFPAAKGIIFPELKIAAVNTATQFANVPKRADQ